MGNILGNKRRLYPVILLIFLFLYIFLDYLWLSRDAGIPFHDEKYHLLNSLEYYHSLVSGHWQHFFLPSGAYYPPLIYQLTAFPYMVFGTGLVTAVMSQSIFLIILLFSVYLLGTELWDEDVGLLAALASLTFPLASFMSHEYFLDIPSASMVALALYCLVKSDGFRVKVWIYSFFMAAGLGMLLKWSVAAFLAAPFLIYTVVFLREIREDRESLRQFVLTAVSLAGLLLLEYFFLQTNRERMTEPYNYPVLYLKSLIPLLMALGVISFVRFRNDTIKTLFQGMTGFLIVIWHFYSLNFFFIMSRMTAMPVQATAEGDSTSFIYYLYSLVFRTLGVPWSLFLVAGIVIYILGKEKCLERNAMAIGALVSLLIFYVIPNKDNRYLIPIIAFAAPFLVFWIPRVRIKALKYGVISLFVVFVLLGWIGWMVVPASLLDKTSLFSRDNYALASLPPTDRGWKFPEMMNALADTGRDKKSWYGAAIDAQGGNRIMTGAVRWGLSREMGVVLDEMEEYGTSSTGLTDDERRAFKVYAAGGGGKPERVVVLYITGERNPDGFSQTFSTYTGRFREFLKVEAAGEYKLPNGLVARILVMERKKGNKDGEEESAVKINPRDGAEMILIPGGEFVMGSDGTDRDADENERPRRKVKLKPYYIYRCEVTSDQFRRFLNDTGRSWGKWRTRFGDDFKNHPIIMVSYEDAKDYARWAGGDLPTEAQWEKAARGNEGFVYPWGNSWDPSLCNNMETHSNRPALPLEGSGGIVRSGTMPVGSFPGGASPYSLLDMAGNAAEWCRDWYDGDYYEAASSENPVGPTSGINRVLRGGSFMDGADNTRCASRRDESPERALNNFGFRVVIPEERP